MTDKELLYVEDALSHAQFLKTQAQTAINQIMDPRLKAQCQDLVQKNGTVFDRFYGLV